jgi:phage shock protein A
MILRMEQQGKVKEKYHKLQNKRLLLLSGANVAQSIKQVNTMTASFNTDHIVKGFALAEERVLFLEAETGASNQFFHQPQEIHALSIDPTM